MMIIILFRTTKIICDNIKVQPTYQYFILFFSQYFYVYRRDHHEIPDDYLDKDIILALQV